MERPVPYSYLKGLGEQKGFHLALKRPQRWSQWASLGRLLHNWGATTKKALSLVIMAFASFGEALKSKKNIEKTDKTIKNTECNQLKPITLYS